MDCKEKGSLADRFHEAVRNGQIRAYYQPVIRSLTHRVMGAEALARWFLPDGSMLSPDEFIPELEKSGLIFELDMEILRQACAFLDELRHCGKPMMYISVNLSRLDFRKDDLFEKVCSILDQYSLPHSAIKLEITESLMLEDTVTFEQLFSRFCKAGFSVWLDDFGSGYSSLNVLQNYSFDVIKFDMHFLQNLSVKGRNMLSHLVSMAKTLGIHTLTEGVETKEQARFLLDIGCEAQQGFLYSSPISKEDVIEQINRKPELLEHNEDADYWNEIGRLDFVNPNPLKKYSQRRMSSLDDASYISSYDASIALVECGQDEFNYVYATEGYKERLRDLGFMSVNLLENALSNQRSHYFQKLRRVVLTALRTGEIQTMEYAYKDVYYRLSALFIARHEGRAMILMRLNTFDAEREVLTVKEMLDESSALMTTYELVVLFYPGSKKSKRIFTANTMPEYDREVSFEISLQKFCENEVDPADQERYLRFLDFSTLAERIENTSRKFIQSIFRLKLEKDQNKWYTARVTQIPALSETVFMLTIQGLQGNLNYWFDAIAEEHPDML